MAKVLLVEDSDGDILLARRAVRRLLGSTDELDVCKNGVAALQYLRPSGVTRSELPVLILVDLWMPVMDGFSLLMELRKIPELARIPTVVLTTSDAETDKVRAYDANANAYLVKPVRYPDFEAVMKSLTDFWLEHNQTCEG